jgi:exodeoxyribonuclease V alpha subunit
MVDIELASRLLEAVAVGTHLLLIGDKDQLPAVGPGKVLEDIIRSKRIPTTELNKIFRQAEGSLIVTNAHRVINGEEMRFPSSQQEKMTADVHRISPSRKANDKQKMVTDYDQVIQEVVSLCKTRLPKAKGLDPLKDIQVLVPMRKQRCGVEELNDALQQALNPNGKEYHIGHRRFRRGDRVMVMRNNYDLNVFNGDLGIIKNVSEDDKVIIIDFYGRSVSFPYVQADDLVLAYASTIHKSQGSEYPCVILVMLGVHKNMFQRNLLYTGLTRAKQLLVIIGYSYHLTECIENVSIKDRTSYLLHRLQKAIPANTC